MIAMTKMCRPISLFCFMLKEVHDYINLKTLDGQFYYDLREKNNQLQKYKDFIYLIENDGKAREPPKEEKKEEPPKVEEQKVEEQKVEEQLKAEEQKATEEETKTETTTEQPKNNEEPKNE